MKKKYYYPHSVPLTYTVAYDANGHGVAPATLTGISYGGYATKPTNPTETGYTFDGWYESGSSIEWDFLNNPVTHNVTLYASWKSDLDSRAHIYMNTGQYYPDWNWGEIVLVNGSTVTKISDAPLSDPANTSNYYVGVWKNDTQKAPWEKCINYSTNREPNADITWLGDEYKLYIGETYRFIAGFSNTSVLIYGVRAIHTDVIDGITTVTEEIIPFSPEPFIHTWETSFEAHELQFTAHLTTLLITLFTLFPT